MASFLIPTILCGGVGARLWPVSRELHPKPFMRLADGQSLLQKAFIRGMDIPGTEEILTVTNQDLYLKIEQEFEIVNKENKTTTYILEPFGRNTAPAVACAALQVQRKFGNEAVMLVLAADHLIKNQQAFVEAVEQALRLAQQGMIVTFGIKPDVPETGYGYIEADGNKVKRFVEKPSLETAESYLKSGCFLWNSGMFCFSAKTLLDEMDIHCPELLQASQECLQNSSKDEKVSNRIVNLDSESFKKIQSISIDYAVMEKSNNVSVIPCEMGWSDIGSWSAVSECVESDLLGNFAEGQSILLNTRNCYVKSSERMTTLVGTQNLIVVDTEDALLVADKAHTQDVKNIFSELKAKDHPTHKAHRTVHYPWGSRKILEETLGYKINRLVIKPGASLSQPGQLDGIKHWIVLSGLLKVINNGQEYYLNPNESTIILPGNEHSAVNSEHTELVIAEILSFREGRGKVT